VALGLLPWVHNPTTTIKNKYKKFKIFKKHEQREEREREKERVPE
jgi:hypothetical protein